MLYESVTQWTSELSISYLEKKYPSYFFFVDIEISKTYNGNWRLAFKEHPASENLSVFTNCCKSNKSSIYFIAIECQMFF